MSWLSQATGIHWGDISKPIVTAIGTVLAPVTGGLSEAAAAAYDASNGLRGHPGSGPTGASSGSGLDTLLGAAGAIQSGADAQRQGALLRDALAAYNSGWTQGRGIRLAPHPVDLSQTFADPSNPFYSPSAGAVATTGANGQPLNTPTQVGVHGTMSPAPGSALPPGATVPTINGHPTQIGYTPPGATPLPGVPPLNLGGPGAAPLARPISKVL